MQEIKQKHPLIIRVCNIYMYTFITVLDLLGKKEMKKNNNNTAARAAALTLACGVARPRRIQPHASYEVEFAGRML